MTFHNHLRDPSPWSWGLHVRCLWTAVCQLVSHVLLTAQLNVDADRLFAKYKDESGQALPIVLMFPHASVSLQLSTGTCTSDIPLAVRNAENYQPLVNYICTKNQWTLSQIDRINWKALQLALKRNNKKRIHYTKLVHNILPTNKVVHRHNPAAQKCPTCANCPHEDRYHIMRCGAQSRDNWRAETITVLEHRCKQLNTVPGLALVLVTGISQWLNGQDTMSPKDFPPKYNQLVLQQNDIGWRQFFNGRMSTEWARIQDNYIYIASLRRSDELRHTPMRQQRQQPRFRNGTHWTGEYITVLWQQWYKVWFQRNATIHGHDRASRALQQQRADAHRLQSIYQNRHLMEPSVQDLLFDTIEEHQQHRSHNTIHNWLSIHETTFIQSVKQVSKQAIQGVQSIKSYFPVRRQTSELHDGSTAQTNTIQHSTPSNARRSSTNFIISRNRTPTRDDRPDTRQQRHIPKQ